VKGVINSMEGPKADEAQKKVYISFCFFKIDVKKNETPWKELTDRRKRNETSNYRKRPSISQYHRWTDDRHRRLVLGNGDG